MSPYMELVNYAIQNADPHWSAPPNYVLGATLHALCPLCGGSRYTQHRNQDPGYVYPRGLYAHLTGVGYGCDVTHMISRSSSEYQALLDREIAKEERWLTRLRESANAEEILDRLANHIYVREYALITKSERRIEVLKGAPRAGCADSTQTRYTD